MKLHTFLFYLGLLFCSFAIATDETCKEKLAKTGAAVSETKKSEVAAAPKKEAPDFNNSIDVQVVDSYARLAMKGNPLSRAA